MLASDKGDFGCGICCFEDGATGDKDVGTAFNKASSIGCRYSSINLDMTLNSLTVNLSLKDTKPFVSCLYELLTTETGEH